MRSLSKIGIICLALIFALTILSSRTLAQSTAGLESRLSRLEADNFQMRSQISRLESQLYTLGGRSLPPQTPSSNRPAPSVPPRANRQVSSSDPMFDRLATLVIELKERVQALEAQVAELKKQRR
jgi:cell division protein FtsB